MRTYEADDCRDAIVTRGQIERWGWTERRLRDAIAVGAMIRLQRNRYVNGDAWRALWPESRHLVAVVAAAEEMTTGRSVLSHDSAAVLHGLPLYRHSPGAVHVTVRPGGGMPSRVGLVRHRDALGEEDVVVIDGIPCTSLERTVFDLGRTTPVETGIAAADAALRCLAFGAESYERHEAERWRSSMLTRVALAGGARGVRRARSVIVFADGRAESPGESVSRWRWAEAGFSDIEVQPLVLLDGGRRRWCDLAIGEIRTLFEFDGRLKYTDPEMRGRRTADEVVIEEKLREDEIRAATGWRLLRAVDENIATAAAFHTYLKRAHIR